ncbi:glycosyltransferase [Methylophaga sulfidovorans]|uniref:Rhamnosyltransferase n=1 Tax=Methylophaga sulfidovorans TaxID=45496 RepID=A0A1I3YPG0_9GAMM|nr:glycosyltransferase [Methylophaga sulfidovorans]SFK33249.1 rhamnosyltransferase [Methylophaga sulfidovorans]
MNLPNKKVAVLLATHNGINWIEEQVHSILEQRDVDVRLIISDDGSTDGTYPLVKQLAKTDARVTLLSDHSAVNGAGKNFYRLIRQADILDADFVAFADQDDIWLSNKLEYQIHTLIKRSVDATSGNVVAFWDDGQRAFINKAQPLKQLDYLFESAGPGCSFCVTRALFDELHNFVQKHADENLPDLHDWLIYAYARAANYQWYIEQRPLLKYRQHQHNVVGVHKGFRASIKRLVTVKQRWYRNQVQLLSYLLLSYCQEKKTSSSLMQRMVRLNFSDRLVLAFNVSKFRRERSHQLVLSLMLITYVF